MTRMTKWQVECKKNKGLLENKNKIRVGRVGGCVASRNWDSNPEKKLDLKGNWASTREDSPSTLREGKEKEEIDERNFFPSNNICSWRHDTQHNDTQHNDTQHNDTQHDDTRWVESLCYIVLSFDNTECFHATDLYVLCLLPFIFSFTIDNLE